ncbi:YncE family protein [Pseudomonas sp. NPDC090202]|uniref:YncE family protein n=1 Tax=unclassified Pseudomonas TaxID=196821 RepID=UPI0038030194
MNGWIRGAFAGGALAVTLTLMGHSGDPLKDANLALGANDNPPALPGLGNDRQLIKNGVTVKFEARPLNGDKLMEGMFADVRFSVTDSATGQPLPGVAPGAWLDPAVADEQAGSRDAQCKSRVGLYLKSTIGARPLLDLNSYFLMVLNKDASATVIDPTVSVGGITSTMSRIALKQPGMDWTSTNDDKRVFVSMPNADEVAIIDAEKFQVLLSVPAGRNPLRVALQPDERYLWVGNNAPDEASSGVTVIDAQTMKVLTFLKTGLGHHEIAFSKDSRYAFVSSRDAGTVDIFDIASLSPSKTLKTGTRPLSVAYSPLSDAVYVADGQDGAVTVIDAKSLDVRKVIAAHQGIGPMSFSDDGRFGFVLNTFNNHAVVIDAASDSVIHDLEVSPEPFQVSITQNYAYIRGLASPRVTMINLSSLGKDRKPILQSFEAGPSAPRLAGDLPLASGLSPARDNDAVFVVNPVDNTTYFYAEGMNAPMSGYPNRGNAARAVRVIDRSLREVEPGVYSSRVRLPSAGKFDVAFMLNQPQVIHCFATQIEVNPALEKRLAIPRVTFLLERRFEPVGQLVPIRIRLVQGRGDKPMTGAKDVYLRYFLAPSSRPREVLATEIGDGIYEAHADLSETGAYYLHVRSESLGIRSNEQSYASLRVMPVDKSPVHLNDQSPSVSDRMTP